MAKRIYQIPGMKRIFIVFLVFATVVSCEKTNSDFEKGRLLFYTNSALINCVFKIELSLNGENIGVIDASKTYSDTNCICDDPSGIGLLLNLKEGTYHYSANEVQCIATNKVNSWSGTVNVAIDSCTVVFLDIFP